MQIKNNNELYYLIPIRMDIIKKKRREKSSKNWWVCWEKGTLIICQ
jgi:hypothetical protein